MGASVMISARWYQLHPAEPRNPFGRQQFPNAAHSLCLVAMFIVCRCDIDRIKIISLQKPIKARVPRRYLHILSKLAGPFSITSVQCSDFSLRMATKCAAHPFFRNSGSTNQP